MCKSNLVLFRYNYDKNMKNEIQTGLNTTVE